MSHNRAKETTSYKCLEYCTYVVREEQEEEYRAQGINDLLLIPKGAVFDFMSTFYWIIENTPEDVIFICDDDIANPVYRTNQYRSLKNDDGSFECETITSEIERIAQLLVDLEKGYATTPVSGAMYNYVKEFEFKKIPSGVRWVNKKHFKAEYNPDDPATSDIDTVYQELAKNRIILSPVYFVFNTKMYDKTGTPEQAEELEATIQGMKNKWGRYVGYNYKRNYYNINVKR